MIWFKSFFFNYIYWLLLFYNLVLITYNLYCLFFDPTSYFYDFKFNIDSNNMDYSQHNANFYDESRTTSGNNNSNASSSSRNSQPTTSSIDIANFSTQDPNVDFNILWMRSHRDLTYQEFLNKWNSDPVFREMTQNTWYRDSHKLWLRSGKDMNKYKIEMRKLYNLNIRGYTYKWGTDEIIKIPKLPK